MRDKDGAMTGKTWPDYTGYDGYEDRAHNPALVRETVRQAIRRHDAQGWPWPVSGDQTTMDYKGAPCVHCRQPVRGQFHTTTGMEACRPKDSGQPFGLSATVLEGR